MESTQLRRLERLLQFLQTEAPSRVIDKEVDLILENLPDEQQQQIFRDMVYTYLDQTASSEGRDD